LFYYIVDKPKKVFVLVIVFVEIPHPSYISHLLPVPVACSKEYFTHNLVIWRIFVWSFGAFSFGHLAHFHLVIWRIFIWSFGRFSFGHLVFSYISNPAAKV